VLKDKADRQYFEARAYLGKGDLDNAEKSIGKHLALKSEVEKDKGGLAELYEIQSPELKARDLLARGYKLEGLQALTAAAEKEFENQKGYADPPPYPES